MSQGQKTGGRIRGVPNKVSAQAKENIIAVFTRLGGTRAMAEWAEENKTEFYKIYSKMLPAEMKLDGSLDMSVTVEVVKFAD